MSKQDAFDIDYFDRLARCLDFKSIKHPFNEKTVTSASSSSSQVIDIIAPPAKKPKVTHFAKGPSSAGQEGPLWMSISKRTGYRRLHRVGACWYRSERWQYLASAIGVTFDAKCRACFKEAEGDEKDADEDNEPSEIDTDEESSSSSEY